MKLRILNTAALAIALSIPAFSQTPQGPTSSATPSGTYPDRGDDARNHNFGWIGLVGLAGLLGLRRPSRYESTTTTDARRTGV